LSKRGHYVPIRMQNGVNMCAEQPQGYGKLLKKSEAVVAALKATIANGQDEDFLRAQLKEFAIPPESQLPEACLDHTALQNEKKKVLLKAYAKDSYAWFQTKTSKKGGPSTFMLVTREYLSFKVMGRGGSRPTSHLGLAIITSLPGPCS